MTNDAKLRGELDAWILKHVEAGTDYCEILDTLITFALDEAARTAPDPQALGGLYLLVSKDIQSRVNALIRDGVMHEVSKH